MLRWSIAPRSLRLRSSIGMRRRWRHDARAHGSLWSKDAAARVRSLLGGVGFVVVIAAAIASAQNDLDALLFVAAVHQSIVDGIRFRGTLDSCLLGVIRRLLLVMFYKRVFHSRSQRILELIRRHGSVHAWFNRFRRHVVPCRSCIRWRSIVSGCCCLLLWLGQSLRCESLRFVSFCFG